MMKSKKLIHRQGFISVMLLIVSICCFASAAEGACIDSWPVFTFKFACALAAAGIALLIAPDTRGMG